MNLYIAFFSLHHARMNYLFFFTASTKVLGYSLAFSRRAPKNSTDIYSISFAIVKKKGSKDYEKGNDGNTDLTSIMRGVKEVEAHRRTTKGQGKRGKFNKEKTGCKSL